jgi:hypothetical protein
MNEEGLDQLVYNRSTGQLAHNVATGQLVYKIAVLAMTGYLTATHVTGSSSTCAPFGSTTGTFRVGLTRTAETSFYYYSFKGGGGGFGAGWSRRCDVVKQDDLWTMTLTLRPNFFIAPGGIPTPDVSMLYHGDALFGPYSFVSQTLINATVNNHLTLIEVV